MCLQNSTTKNASYIFMCHPNFGGTKHEEFQRRKTILFCKFGDK